MPGMIAMNNHATQPRGNRLSRGCPGNPGENTLSRGINPVLMPILNPGTNNPGENACPGVVQSGVAAATRAGFRGVFRPRGKFPSKEEKKNTPGLFSSLFRFRGAHEYPRYCSF